MHTITIIFKIFTSRYLLAAVAFGVWWMFFDRNDFFAQRERRQELKELNQKIEYYRKQVNDTKQELGSLQNDPAMLEKYAREKYFMKKDNEEIFIIEPEKKPSEKYKKGQ